MLPTGCWYCKTPPADTADLSAWPDGDLPWALVDLVPGIPEQHLVADLTDAFGQWSRFCGIRPRYVEDAASARLLVGARSIDGVFGILAETELPAPGLRQVRMWFDTGDAWRDQYSPGDRRLSIVIVGRHEFGHAIGLGHAPDGSANWMAPIYDPTVTDAGPWDVAQAVARYPMPPAPPPPLPAPVPPTPAPTMNLDSVLRILDTALSLFEKYAMLTPNKTDDAVAAALRTLLSLAVQLLAGHATAPDVEATVALLRARLTAVAR